MLRRDKNQYSVCDISDTVVSTQHCDAMWDSQGRLPTVWVEPTGFACKTTNASEKPVPAARGYGIEGHDRVMRRCKRDSRATQTEVARPFEHFRLTAQPGAPHTRPMHTASALLVIANTMNHPWKTHTGKPRGWCAY